MGTVIELGVRPSVQSVSEKQAHLAQCFAKNRRVEDDVFWLKENAEFLNVHETGGARFDEAAFEPYERFYDEAMDRLRFFPQYYRFLLSITLDLEDLGLDGTQGEAICEWVSRNRLAQAELSDLQRAEACRLLARRSAGEEDPKLVARLHAFIDRSATFALPNKKAAYELTHIIFYLTEYGRRMPRVSSAALRSLRYAGTLAFIEENADLLAEICVALKFAGGDVPQAWQRWLQSVLADYRITAKSAAPSDNYHEYLVCNWFEMNFGRSGFSQVVPDRRPLCFVAPSSRFALLRQLSETLYTTPAAQRDDWERARKKLSQILGAGALEHLDTAAAAIEDFESFFSLFARAKRKA